jgi:hypothetical protein
MSNTLASSEEFVINENNSMYDRMTSSRDKKIHTPRIHCFLLEARRKCYYNIILDFEEFLIAISFLQHKKLKKRLELVFSCYGT